MGNKTGGTRKMDVQEIANGYAIISSNISDLTEAVNRIKKESQNLVESGVFNTGRTGADISTGLTNIAESVNTVKVRYETVNKLLNSVAQRVQELLGTSKAKSSLSSSEEQKAKVRKK